MTSYKAQVCFVNNNWAYRLLTLTIDQKKKVINFDNKNRLMNFDKIGPKNK